MQGKGDYSDSDEEPEQGPGQGQGGEEGVLGVGSKVEINYRGQGKFYPGHVTRASDSGSGPGAGVGPGLWDVLYDDGDTETGVPAHHLRLLAQVE